MDSCTLTRTRVTTLPSRALDSLPMAWQGRGHGVSAIKPPAAVQGGAIAVAGMAPVNVFLVTDHPYTTPLGSPSCSPPV
ncbi:MAG: hypothetical protein AVDCRST_MAG61-3304 [uncultured Friedmanniella sp.]|uniref:Uncharacterized protein n=1 Tax=uncultured Friedmanniella sp. TaxID=335381 RepID=A0A6J4LPN5_9ACTN|nr:MAG: hypothetical protein AVDCRST_MAG61-3304 [uncultured Friedmanniella sp.]